MENEKVKPVLSGVPDNLRDALLVAAENRGLFREILSKLDEEDSLREDSRLSPDYRERLIAAATAYREDEEFTVGQLVTWRPNLKNKRRPLYGEPCVVIEVLEAPVLAEASNAGSSYFREKLDIRIGLLDDENELIVYHVDSHRFTSVQ